MNTEKVLKKLNRIGGFGPITIEIENKIVATAPELTDVKLTAIVKEFPGDKYDYKIKAVDGKIVVEFKESMQSRMWRLAAKCPNPFHTPSGFPRIDPRIHRFPPRF